MLKNFKVRISLWYAGLFMLIIASTLFASYRIVSYQLKNEIRIELESKSKIIQTVFNREDEEERGEHSRNKLEEKSIKNDDKESSPFLNSRINDIRLYTEASDNNYSIFVFDDNELIYSTSKYNKLIGFFVSNELNYSQIQEVNVDGIPFSITVVETVNRKVYIAYELSAIKNLQKRLLDIFLIVFPLSFLLSIACGFLVTQSSLKIIKRIDDTAKKITSNNLSKRIEVTDSNDEISKLIFTLNSMIDRLEKSFNQAKQFSQDAAHEIRTPLTIITGEIEELIVNERGNPNTIKTLENILEEVQYLSSISGRLLMIHNMDTDNIKYHFESINLSELMKEIYQDVTVLSLEKNIKVELKIPNSIKVNGNKELITRLLWNISDNAIKYNKQNGSVWISLSEKDSQIIIQVKDSGIGIPGSEISKIFNRFYRVDKSRSRQFGGSGLGLSICKWIAEIHNAEITVESETQLGSTFTIKIARELKKFNPA